MITYLIFGLGMQGSPYFAVFLIAILGILIGRYLKTWICMGVSIITFSASLLMLATTQEITALFAVSEIFYSLVLSISMWVTVLVTTRNESGSKNIVQSLKTKFLR
ncbi:MAG: hypothetical protein Q7S32_02715 [bacterium]|nr:hypothetical protein [bacterium]